jgi:hypothetical protein
MTYYSRVTYTGNGSNTDFVLPFPYLEKDDISLTVNNQVTAFTWTNDSTIHVSPAPANGLVVFIKRTTDIDAPKVDYTDGSTLTELDLDTSHRQEVYKLQEIIDALADVQTALTTVQVTTGNLPVVSGGDNGKILVVVGGVWTPVLPTSITVLTDYQIDGTTYKFQKKNRTNVKVVGSDAESAWTDVHTGGPCS